MAERNNKSNIKIGKREMIKTVENIKKTKNWISEKQTECTIALTIQWMRT